MHAPLGLAPRAHRHGQVRGALVADGARADRGHAHAEHGEQDVEPARARVGHRRRGQERAAGPRPCRGHGGARVAAAGAAGAPDGTADSEGSRGGTIGVATRRERLAPRRPARARSRRAARREAARRVRVERRAVVARRVAARLRVDDDRWRRRLVARGWAARAGAAAGRRRGLLRLARGGRGGGRGGRLGQRRPGALDGPGDGLGGGLRDLRGGLLDLGHGLAGRRARAAWARGGGEGTATSGVAGVSVRPGAPSAGTATSTAKTVSGAMRRATRVRPMLAPTRGARRTFANFLDFSLHAREAGLGRALAQRVEPVGLDRAERPGAVQPALAGALGAPREHRRGRS